MEWINNILGYGLAAAGTAIIVFNPTAVSPNQSSVISNQKSSELGVRNSELTTNYELLTANSSQSSVSTVTKQPEAPKRHRINVTLTSPEDLKVAQGDRIEVGAILADRTQARQQLEAKKKQLEIAIERMSLPLPQVSELPPPDFATEEAAIETARAELELLKDRPAPEFRFKKQVLQEIHEKGIYTEQLEQSEARTKAAIALNQAIARLEEARAKYQNQQYQHSLNLIQQQTNQQRQQYQLASLVSQLQEVEGKLDEITAVYSPYSGRVRRIKITGQSDRLITAEITLDVR